MCTQANANLQVSLGDSTVSFEDLPGTGDPETKGFYVTAQNTGKVSLTFAETTGHSVSVQVKNVVIDDGLPANVEDTAGYSVFLDPDNVCSGTRWEAELPATEEGVPYKIQVSYGDKRIAVETAGCQLGTSGHMQSVAYSDNSDGVVPKGSLKTVEKTIFVPSLPDSTKGRLIFQGELVSGCTGINSIKIEKEDSVLWTPCETEFSKAWSLNQSRSSPGNFQLVMRSRTSLACVDPMTGKMVECVAESNVKDHIKQVFTLDYLAPLVSKWTHFEASQEFQQGACVEAHGKYLPNLKLSNDKNLVSCTAQHVLSGYRFKQDVSCNSENDFRYFHTCAAIIPVTTTSSCVNMTTRCIAHSRSDPHIWELDRHDVGAECAQGMLLTRFRYISCDEGSGYQYEYTCCPAQGVGECKEMTTEWGEVGDLSDLSALQHHHVECPTNSALKRFILEAQVPEVSTDEKLEGEVRYKFVCCQLPLAAPISIKTGPLLMDNVLPWEGTYCPTDRVEGRPDFGRKTGTWPQFVVEHDMSCGECGWNDLDIGRRFVSEPTQIASVCGATCAAHPLCGGFHVSDGQCIYKKSTTCQKQTQAGHICWSLANASTMKISFDRLAGHWCLKTSGVDMCSDPTDVSHPVEMPAGAVDYVPLIPMDTQFEGTGASEVNPGEMAESLLGVAGAVTGGSGGLTSKKFKKLPKIPQAKFQMAKFEKAEFEPFKGKRSALEKRRVETTVLNWAPDAIAYAPHCLARHSRETITGAEAVEVAGEEHFLSENERQKDVVGECYHTLGLDAGEPAATTWGEDASDWSRPFPLNKVLGTGQADLPGLTSEALWECSNRESSRAFKMDQYESYKKMGENIMKKVSTSVLATCASLPPVVTLVGGLAAYVGQQIPLGDICKGVSQTTFGLINYVKEKHAAYQERRDTASGFADCAPLQSTMAKVYCDLSCVEDAVKRGDQHILESIGTLNQNILSEMKAFFDHYVSQIFTRLTHIEDKSSHEVSELKNVMDVYAKADIDAVNSNGKQLINAMNTQHQAMNDNLNTAAKQIYDLSHKEHGELATLLKGSIDAVQDLKTSSESFNAAFDDFTDTLKSEDLLEVAKVKNVSHAVMEEFSRWGKDSMQKLGASNLKLIHEALLALQRRVAAVRRSDSLVLTKHVLALHQDVKTTMQQLLDLRVLKNFDAGAAQVDANMKKNLAAAARSIETHLVSAARMGEHMELLQEPMSGADGTSTAFRVELVEFDKTLVKIRQAADQYLTHGNEEARLATKVSELTDQYLTKCSSDFWEVRFAARKALASGKKAASAARRALQDVSQQLGLLAEILVDGGLVQEAVRGAAMKLTEDDAEAPNRAASADSEEVPDSQTSHGVNVANLVELFQLSDTRTKTFDASALLTMQRLHHAVHIDLLSSLRLLMPPILPKARAAFLLFNELRRRHDMHGLASLEHPEVDLMISSWNRLDSQVALLASESRLLNTSMGQVYGQRFGAALEALAPVPTQCQVPMKDRKGWVLWASRNREWILVRGVARLLQHTRGQHRHYHDFSNQGDIDAAICSEHEGSVTLRPFKKGEFVLCFGQKTSEDVCTSWLQSDMPDPDLWMM